MITEIAAGVVVGVVVGLFLGSRRPISYRGLNLPRRRAGRRWLH